MVLTVSTQTKAVLTASHGRVIGIVNGNEPGVLSLAVPGDRAVLTPSEARELARWLNETAAKAQPAPRSTVTDDFLAAERRVRAGMASEEFRRQARIAGWNR